MKPGWRMEEREEGLCLPRRACFILGLSMVTVAILLLLTETWPHPSVHTLFLTYTLYRLLSLLPRPVTPHPLRASLSLAHSLALCLILHSHTHTHTLNLTLSSGSPLSFTSDSPSLSHWPSTLLFLTYLEPCLLSPSLSLWSVSLSVTLPSAAHSQYQFLTIYTYVWLGVLCLVILFCVFSFAIAPQSSQSPQLVVEIWLWAHVNPDVQPQINIFDSTDISLTTKCYDAVKVDVTPRCRRIAVNLRSFADIFKWN